MAAQGTGLIGAGGVPVVGQINAIHASALNPVGTCAYDILGNEYIYLQGIGSTIAGSVVTYQSATYVTALIAADAKGPVAVANAAVVAAKFGWYLVAGIHLLVDVVANSTAGADAGLGRETTDGKVGDGRAAGDQIHNMIQLTTTVAAALVPCQLDHPFVDNIFGS